MFRRKHLSPFQNPPRPIVAVPHLKLFCLGHRQDSQRQNFIDFGAVEKVPCTFRRDLRVVVENDGAAQNRVRFPLLSYQNGPQTGVVTFGRRRFE